MINSKSSFAALLLAAMVLPAQDTRGKIQGRVTDQSDAVIVGSTVTLSNDNTGVTANMVTNATGQYLFDFVIPGTYTVSMEMTGFRKFVQKNVLVQARADVTVDARLETGSTRESITVEASPITVQFNPGFPFWVSRTPTVYTNASLPCRI